MGRFFGTDGFRGEAGVKLTAELAYKTGRFLGYYYKQKKAAGERCRIVIGEDTRLSCSMIENALAAGITASGADVYLMHVTTTPSVSYAARNDNFDCGVMISASHNPYYDNGIKVINGDGSKLGDGEIAEVESYLDGSMGEIPYALRAEIGTVNDYSDGREHYRDHLIAAAIADAKNVKSLETAKLSDEDRAYARTLFAGRKIALDCANGSASFLAKEVYEALGAEVIVKAYTPDGTNINDKVGSTHIDSITAFTKENNCEIGFAYDGDADRCLASDEKGQEINGDQLIYACALNMRSKGLLKDDTAVVTVMSNFGLFRAFEREGIRYEKTAVGDRFVWECMSEHGYKLGGEQSGHIIFADNATTGDGILTSLKTMRVLIESKKKASELFEGCKMYPQSLKNVRVEDKKAAVENEEVRNAVLKAEKALGDTGRVLLRESGTEPVVRVMAEAPTKEECEKHCDDIIAAMKAAGVII